MSRQKAAGVAVVSASPSKNRTKAIPPPTMPMYASPAQWLGPQVRQVPGPCQGDPGLRAVATNRAATESRLRRRMPRATKTTVARKRVATRFFAVVYTDGGAIECTP